MNGPSESLALDRAFPATECIWQEEAERYVKTGSVYEAEVVPYYGYAAIAYSMGMPAGLRPG